MRCALALDAALLEPSRVPGRKHAEMIEPRPCVGEVLRSSLLPPARVGGRLLDAGFLPAFAALECVAAIKIAPFNRYQTLDVLRGVAESGRLPRLRSIPAMTITSCST